MSGRIATSFGVLVCLMVIGCGSDDDGGTGPTPPPAPIEDWRVAAESSFDITSLTWEPDMGLVAVGADRVLTGGPSAWVDIRLENDENLRDVWATTGLTLAVGDDGLVLRRETSGWNRLDPGSAVDLRAVSGRTSADVLVVGNEGTILHFDGVAWHDQSVIPAETFMDVWCEPAGDDFAVSAEGNVWSGSGGTWSIVDLGIASYVLEEFVGLVGLGDGRIMAFGDHERVLLFDGANWSVDRDGPTAHPIVALAAGPGRDPIAVTADRRILSRTAGSWQVSATLGFPNFPAALCVGLDGGVYLGGAEAGVLQMAADPDIWNVVHRYWTDDIVAAVADGQGGHLLLSETGLIRERIAGEWTSLRPDPATIVTKAWSVDGNTIVTIGVPDQVAVMTGTGFTVESLGLNLSPRGIDGQADGTILLVGRDGRIVRGSVGAWSEQASGTTEHLWDVRFLPTGEALAVGEAGTALVWNGASWQAESTGTTATLLELALGPDGEIYALGRLSTGTDSYQVFRRSGGGWEGLAAAADLGPDPITGITIDADRKLHACSSRGNLFLYQDSRWYLTASLPAYRLSVITANDDGSILAAGGDGAIITFP